MDNNLYKYNAFFSREIINIYHSWININKSLYLKYYNLVGIILMSLLIPFDFILYKDNNIYTEYRVVYIIIILLNFFYIQMNQQKLFERKEKYKIHYNLLLPGLLFNLLYVYYFYVTPSENYSIILLANFITILTTTMFAMKFWKEQYAINILSVLVIIPCIVLDLVGSLYLIGFHLLSFVSAYIYRRQFIISMYERYCNTASLVPKNVAKYIAMTDGTINLEKVFKPSKRFTVCLSSDWRDFQKIFSSNKPEFIENLFQEFYNEVFIHLDDVFPDGNYYADWTADELFIIFFSNDEDDSNLMKKSLEFAHIYATEVFTKINANLDINLLYDIGMSSGIGLLGLQGPEKLKKTTITGESAGKAKRLESEAKNLRDGDKIETPILLIDQMLYDKGKEMSVFKEEFLQLRGTIKDIKDEVIYKWIKKNN